MDPEEKLTALKKAYADIILNTAKEAAARIMVSERKSLRLQHELNASKEQAIQMLLRLKQMLDYRIREAETTSMRQKRKIEELEAQLQEAEDIVKDLREELRQVHDEVERLRYSKSEEKKTEVASPTTARVKKSALDIINEVYRSFEENNDNVENDHIVKSDISPISEEIRLNTVELRDESKPVYSVNGFCIAHLSKNRLNSIELRDEVNKGLSENGVYTAPISEENRVELQDEVNKGYSRSSFYVSPISEESRLNAVGLGDVINRGHSKNGFHKGNFSMGKPNLPSIILGSKRSEPYRNRRTQRIRAFEEKLMAGELTFSDTVDDVKYAAGGRKDGKDEGPIASSMKHVLPAVDNVKCLKRKRRRLTRCKRKKILPLSGLLSEQALDSDQTSDISCRAVNSDNDDEAAVNPLDLLSRLSEDMQDEGTNFECTGVSKSNECPKTVDFGSNGSVDVDKVDVAVVTSEAQASGLSDEISQQPANERVFKYTFQRKKKKQSPGNSELDAPIEKNIMEVKEEEIQNDHMDTEMSLSTAVPSRDSRRVAQVARQLISLSEKKWWQ